MHATPHRSASTCASRVGSSRSVPRGSSANALDGEFIGDYNWIVATNSFAVAVYNDVRDAADCPKVDAYRAGLASGGTPAQPSPGTDCPSTFGNTDIYAARVTP